MIPNAKDVPLTASNGTLPNTQAALLDYFQTLTFSVITKATVDFEVQESRVNVVTKGVFQPLSAQKLMMKPEGQRSWEWRQIHADPGLVLAIDSLIFRGRTCYRVLERFDYREYGFVEYHVANDYVTGAVLTEDGDTVVDDAGDAINA